MTHTAKQMAPAIGETVQVQLEKFTIPMVVLDVKSSWGAIRLEVEPVSGSGRAWISIDRCLVPTPRNQRR